MICPGKSADIGAAVAADFGFVVHAAERNAHELASQRAGNRLAERGFAHAWRPEEAQDRTFHPRLQLLHRQVIEDALLDLFEIVVILVENLLALDDIDFRRRPTTWSTAARSSTPGRFATPCTRPKPESSFAAA